MRPTDAVRPADAPGRRRFVLLHLAPLSLVLGGMAWRLRGFAIDDFFITYRYALHLAAGQGFRFNPDEAVFGTTAPGFALLLAALRAVTGAPLPFLGALVTFVSLLVVCALLLAESWPRRRPEGVAAAWLIAGSTLLWIHVGGEMLTVAALILLAGHLAAGEVAAGPAKEGAAGGEAPARRRRWRGVAAGLLAGLAVTFRPDAALGVAALGIWLWWRGRRLPQRFGWPAAGVIALGLLAARAWFGRFLPETLEAKRLQSRWLPESWPGGADFWPSFLETAAAVTPVVPLVVLGVAGAALAWRRGGGALRALLLWAGATVVAYPLLGVAVYPWYGIPVFLALTVGATFAAGAAGRRLLRFLEGEAPPRRSAGARLAAALLALVLLAPLALTTLAQARRTLTQPVNAPRLELYRQAGRWLAGHTPPDARIAAIEVGTLGFYSRRHVHDLLGLVSPEALPHIAEGDLVGAFHAGRPDHFVYYSPIAGLLDRVRESPGFADEWREVARFEHRGAGVWLAILRRDGGDAPPGAAAEAPPPV